jgi:hypothetical protein
MFHRIRISITYSQPIRKTMVFVATQKTPVLYTLLAGVVRGAEFPTGLSTVASKLLTEVTRLQQVVFAEMGDLSEVVLIRDIAR